MTATKNLMVAMALVLALVGASQAQAANYYAAVDIRNPTHVTLNYQFRWGPDSEWQSFSVAPNSVMTHFWAYAFADQNSSPVPQIRFHYNPAEVVAQYKTYNLEAYAVPFKIVGVGKKYTFRYDVTGGYLELYKD